MKKKNGFIAISLIYSFFLCFIMIMMGLLANYTHSKLILDKINTPLEFKKQTEDNTCPDGNCGEDGGEDEKTTNCSNDTNGKKLLDVIEEYEILTYKPDFFKGFPNKNTSDEDVERLSGLYQTQDDDGDSYYFRGAVENNYVKFGKGKTERNADEHDLTWRILRINGDKSIRLILNDEITSSIKFNSKGDSLATNVAQPNMIGYTSRAVGDILNGNIYQACTKYTPCTNENNNDQKIPSIAKEYLDNWYKNNLSEYDNLIEISEFCNDTSIKRNGSLGATSRLSDKSKGPTLKCPLPEENRSYIAKYPNNYNTYGGVYKLKIGLINVDEMVMAGIDPSGSYENYTTELNFLIKSMYSDMMTMSPLSYSGMGQLYHGHIISTSVYKAHPGLFPVISLKSNVIVTSGDGTKNCPYIIEKQ